MLKKDKPEEDAGVVEEPETPEVPEDGDSNKEVMDLLRAVLHKQGEQDEQIAELSAKDVTGQAKLLIASLAYDTPPERMAELSRIPLTMVDPMVTDMTLDALLDEKVLAGTKSLGEVETLAYLQLMRSVGGEHLRKARETAEEEKASEGDQSGAEFRLGQE